MDLLWLSCYFSGDIVVPRPPRNTRKPSIKIAKLIARREKMQQHLLNVVDPLILEEAHKHLSNSQSTSDQSERFKVMNYLGIKPQRLAPMASVITFYHLHQKICSHE